MPVGVIVPAAGLGVRLGPGDPKAMRGLCGEPLLAHAVRSLLASGRIDQLVVAAPAGRDRARQGGVEQQVAHLGEGGVERLRHPSILPRRTRRSRNGLLGSPNRTGRGAAMEALSVRVRAGTRGDRQYRGCRQPS